MPETADAPQNQTAQGIGSLASIPERVMQAGRLIDGFDQCLLAGFGRLGADHSAALGRLGRAFAGTPLAKAIDQALSSLRANVFEPRHLAVLAAARVALQGARYDALLADAAHALGRSNEPESPAAESAEVSPANVLCDAARQWLMELALCGLKQLDASALAPFSATLENIESAPALARLAALLGGFRHEMLAALPIKAASDVPLYRWADLWATAMVGSLQGEKCSPDGLRDATKASGTLTALGVDLRQHGSFASAVIYSLLEPASGGPRVVRITLSSFKVDAIGGREVWRCFAQAPLLPLLRAVGERLPLKISDMTLLATGDLLWDGTAAETRKPADVHAVAARFLAPAAGTRFPRVAPADRHPVQLAELVSLQGIRAEGAGEEMRVIVQDGVSMPVARVAPTGELTDEDLIASNRLVGLLRFDDGRWLIQPLAVAPGATRDKRESDEAFVGSSAYQVATKKPKKGEPNTFLVLQERASRLLRKKS